jgi:cytochrome c-type biogenesis protein
MSTPAIISLPKPFRSAGATVVAIAIAALIAASWLVFPYLVKGQHLLQDVGTDVKQERLMQSIGIGQFLTRTTFGTGEAQVDMLYAPPRYFEITDRADVVRQYRPDRYLIFIVAETTHIEDLPVQLPEARLLIDGKAFNAYDIEGPIDVFHHRATTIRFAKFDESGAPVLTDSTREIELRLSSTWDPDTKIRSATWDMPVVYPDNLRKPTAWNAVMVLAVAAGLLSFVLTPCLLQLIFVYVATLTGLSADRLTDAGQTTVDSTRQQMHRVAIAFVIGFCLLFTSIGALIGHAGKQMQLFISIWSSTISTTAGILVIAMGLWIGIQARVPYVCRIASGAMRERMSGNASTIGAALTAIGFSLGCMTCFGGAIIATLLVYVGSLGSALVGASVMFVFSLGIVVPFLLSAFFLARALPALAKIRQFGPTIGVVSMIVMIAFGLVLVTDNFHVVSDMIYPYLGLS